MKPSLTVIVLITAMLTSCNLEPGPMSYTNVAIPFEEYQVPETGIIDQPVNIYVSARADNGCWSNIRFLLKQNDDREFDAWAIETSHQTESAPLWKFLLIQPSPSLPPGREIMSFLSG